MKKTSSTEEVSIECESCKNNFMHMMFYWRQTEKQAQCTLCNTKSEHNDHFFCNTCKTDPCYIEENHIHIHCDLCEKDLGISIHPDEPDLNPCPMCKHDVLISSEVECVCNSCRWSHC